MKYWFVHFNYKHNFLKDDGNGNTVVNFEFDYFPILKVQKMINDSFENQGKYDCKIVITNFIPVSKETWNEYYQK